MRWPFRSRGTAQADGSGPGDQAVRPSGQWRELPAAASVLPPQPTANSRGFVRTLPSRWQQPAVLAPLSHEVTADAPGGLVSGLAVGVAPPAGVGSPSGVAGRRSASPADEVATERPVTGLARVARGLPGASLLRRARPGRPSGGSLLDPAGLDQGYRAMPGRVQPIESQPNQLQPNQLQPNDGQPTVGDPTEFQPAEPQPPVSPGSPQQVRAALGAARPIGQTAPIRVLSSGASTPAEPGPGSLPLARSAGAQEAAPSRSAWPDPRTPQEQQAGTATAEQPGETPGAVTARSPFVEAAVEAPLTSQRGSLTAGRPQTSRSANTPTGEEAAAQPWSRPSALAARDTDPGVYPSRTDTAARAAPGRPAALVRPADSVSPAVPAVPAGSVVSAVPVVPAVPAAPAGVVSPAVPAAPAPRVRAGAATGISPAGIDATALQARPQPGPLAADPGTETSPGAAGAGLSQPERPGGPGSAFGSADLGGTGSGQAVEPAGSPISPSRRLRRRARLGPPLTGLAAQRISDGAAGLTGHRAAASPARGARGCPVTRPGTAARPLIRRRPRRPAPR